MKTLTAALAVLIWTAQPAAAGTAFTGYFDGGVSRDCGGDFYVRTRTMGWDIQFSACGPSPYRVLNQSFHAPKQDGDHIDFLMLHPGSHCYSPVVILYYFGPPPDGGWMVFGFETIEDYRAFSLKRYDRNDPKDYPYLNRVSACGLYADN